ncbi:MAG TPA: hypothetical protein PK274_08250 [Candidatus Fermentibacter daniensis]|nr:hypothetical protein [Candidatus Fermentibacter daniensis]HPN63167.1 hypothetical protein [Candidatus Fermentibacter daniensis]
MALLDLLKGSPGQLKNKHVQQLIAFAGKGKLIDDSECSKEFRSFLSSVASSNLKDYAEQCLSQSFTDSGLVLQDIINEIGSRLDAEVTPGCYRGTPKNIGYDGVWRFANGHSIVVEVKTTDSFRIDLNTIANYRRDLIDAGSISEKSSSMLLVVGRQDTGDLEAQIRGSRHAWDIRIISVDALLRFMSTKEEVDDPQIIQRIHSILIPREFTRLDDIVDVIFSTTEDIRQDEAIDSEVVPTDKRSKEPKFTPVAFHESCISRIQAHLDKTLIKRTRTQYSSADKSILVNCAVSKEHSPDTNPYYWFAFHLHHKETLEHSAKAFIGFGCGSSERILLIPFLDFEKWLDGLWITQTNDRFYWHVMINRSNGKYTLQRKKSEKPIDLTKYLLLERTI